MDPLVLPTQQGYDRWAAIYDDERNPLCELEQPELARVLGEVAGLAVLDVGCGTGRHALGLAAAGARVTAVDFSAGMLARARGKPGADRVVWCQHDLARPLPFADQSFDRVVCALVVDHVADLAGFFAALARVCREGGAICVSVMHPAMMLRGVQARFVDPTTQTETRPASVAHQICDYVMAVERAGLRFRELSEHAVGSELAERNPRAARYLGWPMLLLMALARR
jgi:malonyl-CoA O-methyltransferase